MDRGGDGGVAGRFAGRRADWRLECVILETQRDLRWGSWLHDCGKIGVPESILNFPGPLDPTMRAVIDQHPAWGADIARRGNLPRAVVDIILHHHERVDGAGYPGRLRGAEIPLLARIVGAADVYDAMTSDRAYKRGLRAG